jgi:hypothetical protein
LNFPRGEKGSKKKNGFFAYLVLPTDKLAWIKGTVSRDGARDESMEK